MDEILTIVNQGINGDNAMLLAALVMGYASKHLKDKYAKKEQLKSDEMSSAAGIPEIMAALSRIEEKIDGIGLKKPKLLTEVKDGAVAPRRGRPKKEQST